MKSFLLVLSATAMGLLFSSILAAEPAPMTAADLAPTFSARQQDGNSFVKLRMEIQPDASRGKTVLQLQIKQRRTATATDVVYQIIWPKERIGEAVWLRKVGDQAAVGTVVVASGATSTLTAEQMQGGLFGSDLAYVDCIENYFNWGWQRLAGNELIARVNCQILESKPGKDQRSVYSSVRTWVDLVRLVPLRVEKYLPSGELVRRIDTTRLVKDATQGYLPASLAVRGVRPSTLTELTGSKIKRDVGFTEQDFTLKGMKDLSTPRQADEK